MIRYDGTGLKPPTAAKPKARELEVEDDAASGLDYGDVVIPDDFDPETADKRTRIYKAWAAQQASESTLVTEQDNETTAGSRAGYSETEET